MIPSAAASASTACCSRGVISWLVSAVPMSVASSRRSITAGAHRGAALARQRGDPRRGPVGQQPGRGRVRRPAADHHEVQGLAHSRFPFVNSSSSFRTGAGPTSFPHSSSSWRSSSGVSPASMAWATERPCRRPMRRWTERPSLGQRQADAAAVARVGRPADQAPVGQPVHHPGQGRLAEQHVPVELGQPDRVRRTWTGCRGRRTPSSSSRPRRPARRTAGSARRGRSSAPPTRRWPDAAFFAIGFLRSATGTRP